MDDKEKEERHLAAGRNFKRALERAGLKQVDVMSKTGASQGQVSNWAARGVSAQFAPMVAAMLGVKPGQICASIHGVVGGADVPAAQEHAPGPVVREEQAHYRRPEPRRPDRLQRLVDALDEADLGVVDLALLEELVHRLERPNRGR